MTVDAAEFDMGGPSHAHCGCNRVEAGRSFIHRNIPSTSGERHPSPEDQDMRIGPFIPCYIDAFSPEVGIATLVETQPLATSSIS